MSIYDIEALAYSGLHRDMTYRLRRVTPPTVPVATFEEACAHLRLGDPTDAPAQAAKPLVDRLVKAAGAEIERYCDRALLTQEWELSTAFISPRSPCYTLWHGVAAWRLPKPPMQSLTTIYVDDFLLPDTAYGVVIDERLPAVIYGKPSLPVSQTSYPDAIKLRWIAGVETPDDVPAEIVQAALMMVATWYENPAGASPCKLEALPDVGIMDTLDYWRVQGFSAQ
jgi:uncharacterized phiE125 gp8 family phage protein